MKITNPLDKDISVSYRGVDYTVDANSSINNVPDKAAIYWKSMIHNFIIISSDSEPVKEVEVKKEVIEEIVENVVKEKPKKKSTQKVIKK